MIGLNIPMTWHWTRLKFKKRVPKNWVNLDHLLSVTQIVSCSNIMIILYWVLICMYVNYIILYFFRCASFFDIEDHMNLNLQPTPSRHTHVFGSISSELTSQYSEGTRAIRGTAIFCMDWLDWTNANECPKQIQEFSLQKGIPSIDAMGINPKRLCCAHTHGPVTRARSIIQYMQGPVALWVWRCLYRHCRLWAQIFEGSNPSRSVLVFCFFASLLGLTLFWNPSRSVLGFPLWVVFISFVS